jgi:hypothetical protein
MRSTNFSRSWRSVQRWIYVGLPLDVLESIEVKSAKANACIEAGYVFEFWIIDARGQIEVK